MKFPVELVANGCWLVTVWMAIVHLLAGVVGPLFLGIMSSFLVVLFVEHMKGPRLTFTVEAPHDETYDPAEPRPARKARFVRLIVRNEPLPKVLRRINRESAMDCRAEIQFSSAMNPMNFDPMVGRWAGNPQPVPLEGLLGAQHFQIWDLNISHAAASGINIPPGEQEKLDIVARFDDENDAYGWSNASYLPPLWRTPKWKLGRGQYAVTVTVRSGGLKWSSTFELYNDGARGEMRLM